MQREQILAAAGQIFRQKGYQATSMQDIADAVHLQKGSLYHHVRSKEEILVTLLDRALDLLIESMERVLNSDLSPEEKLREAMRAYAEHIAVHSDLAAVLLLEYRNLSPRYRHRHIARRDRFEGLWRDLIREGIRKGAFQKTDVTLAARAVLAVQNWMVTWYQPGGARSAADLAEFFSSLFLRGLRSNHATS